METDRGRNDKVRCAVIDTNVLMYIFLEKIDVFGQLKDLGFRRFFVPSMVVEELKRLEVSLTGKERRAARFALNLVEQMCEVVDVDAAGTDVALLDLAKSSGCVLITNDKRLKKRAAEMGITVGYIREMCRVDVEE
ncbi:type II toxin-antitoxin system VapC family toxin [Archaeoglobus veneficus]|uniref:Ribonuclease VapC n=1 Tax=Archaeoglobus veneficus (strain DSM 11195 / SNP6) TaxID=693661 RepID=F2KMU5_ARCVS|nr:PIN domain-containing protein [Archaeoglobus veneficus]AEA46119.1 Nucleotide binding protein PINc [Archaeoglobus veneficus SNP6]